MVVEQHPVVLHGGLQLLRQRLVLAVPVPAGVPDAHGVDHRGGLPQPGQVLLIPGHGQVGGVHQQGGQVVEGQLHPLGLRYVVVGPEDEGHHLFFLGQGGIRGRPQHVGIEVGGHLGLVVAEEEDQGGLLHLGEVAEQVFEGLIALVHQGQILVDRVEAALQRPGEPHLPGQVRPRHLVGGVVLHGHVEEKQRLPRLLLLIPADQVLVVALVGDIAGFFVPPHVLPVLEVPLKVYLVKAEIPVNRGTAPAGGAVGVGGHGAVTQGGHLPHQGGIAVGDIHLVGHRACGQEGGGVAGEELVLRVGGGAAEHGGVGVALNGVLRQGAEEGHGVRIALHAGQHRKVGEGLVHDDNDVHRANHAVLPGRRHGGRVAGSAPGEGREGLLRVGLRLLHPHVLQAHREVKEQAVAPGRPHGGLNAPALHKPGAEKHAQIDRGGPGRRDKEPPREGPFLLVRQEGQGQQHRREHADGEPLHGVGPVVVVARHVGGGAEGEEVAGKEGASPEGDQIVVGHAQAPGDPHGPLDGRGPPPEDEVEKQLPQVVPRQIEGDLKGGEVSPGVVVVEVLHQGEGEQGGQEH